jgi:hypothetical protein
MKKTVQLLAAAAFAAGLSGTAWAGWEYPCGTNDEFCIDDYVWEISVKCDGVYDAGLDFDGEDYDVGAEYDDEEFCDADGEAAPGTKTEIKCQGADGKKHDAPFIEVEIKDKDEYCG